MTPRALFLPIAVCAALGCSKADTLTVKPASPDAPELVPSPLLEEYAYHKILLLPFTGTVQVEGLESDALKERDGAYYTNKIEKGLLAHGFEVISPEIVSRAKKSVGATASAAEKAMQMGRETKAHAVFIVQSIAIEPRVDYYSVEKLESTKVDPAKVDQNLKHGQFFDKDTQECVYRLPYYVVRMESKLIDVQSGQVLWVGSGKQTAIDTLGESYVAKLDKECKLIEENFVFADKLAGEGHLAATFAGLVTRLLDPLKVGALKGKKIVLEKPPKKEPPPPKEEPKPPEPEKTTAVVSTKNANLRAGPGSRNERMRRLSRKTKVTILETMGEWSKVELQDGTQGWMHESTIIVND